MTSVFISYSSKDRQAANYFTRELERLGIDVFVDHQGLQPGDPFTEVLGEEIVNCDSMIVLLSEKSVLSPRVVEEVNHANNQSKMIVPIRLDESVIPQSIFFLAQRQDMKFDPYAEDEEKQRAIYKLYQVITNQTAKVSEKEPLLINENSDLTNTLLSDSEVITGLSSAEVELLNRLREEFRDVNRRKFTFLVVGKTGVGKSTTINSLVGYKVCPTGRYDPTTARVSRHGASINGILFDVVDTPGLGDHSREQDLTYMRKILRRVRRIDSLLFATRLDEHRLDELEERIIDMITEAFGPDIWNRAVIMFTHADKVDREDYKRDLRERTKRVRKSIERLAGTRVANQVPSVAIANDKKTERPLPTPDGKSWLGEVYTQVFLRVSDEGAIPFFLATASRIRYTTKEIASIGAIDSIPTSSSSTYSRNFTGSIAASPATSPTVSDSVSTSGETKNIASPIVLDNSQSQAVGGKISSNPTLAAISNAVSTIRNNVVNAAKSVWNWITGKK